MEPKIKFFAGSASKELAKKIVKNFAPGTELGKSTLTKFKDGEFVTSLDETVRGHHVFIIQSTRPPVENLMELMMMADAAKRASAKKITAIIPYFGFARQDRKDQPRVPIGARLVADLLTTSGIDEIITMDLHADQIQGFFNIPVDHIYASTIFVPYLESQNLDNLIIASPDMGGAKRAKAYSKFLKTDMAIAHKSRTEANKVAEMLIIGNVRNKNVVLVDDILDTGGTLAKAAEIIMDKGAKSVRVAVTHPLFSEDAFEIMNNSQICEIITTDSIPVDTSKCNKINVLSIGELFGSVIYNILNNHSISEHFIA
jgi:ribose-phosphate pyrophosphokinase